jgi:uncharacterized MAPEG superfamily protein
MVSTFADAVRHATRFADADTDAAFVVADDHDGAEGEATATLDNLRHALNIDDPFVEFFAVFFAGFLLTITLWTVITATCALAAGFISARLIATGFTACSVATAATLRFLLWLICHFTSTLKF